MSKVVMFLFSLFLTFHNEVFVNGDYFSTSGYLTSHENEWIQAVCGHKPGVKPAYGHKSLNSDDAFVTDAPWTVTIFNDIQQTSSSCSGSLISQRHVLTAAHCVQYTSGKITVDYGVKPPKRKSMVGMESQSPSTLLVVLGDNCARNSPGCRENTTGTRQVVHVRRFWVHADYKRNDTSDIAILELSSDVFSSKNVMPICLGDGPLAMSQSLQVYGSGRNGPSAQKLYQLQHISVRVVDCLEDSAPMRDILLRTKEFCTLSQDPGRKQAACKGDSGSGVVDGPDKSGKMHLHGIVSQGSACTLGLVLPNFVYVDHHTLISPYINWIARKTGVCPTGHSCENQYRSLGSDTDGALIESGETQTLFCDDETWLFSVKGTNALCYKIAWWDDGKLNARDSGEKCRTMNNAQLAPVRNQVELLTLRDALAKSSFKMNRYDEINVIVGGFWDAHANHFKWEIDHSEALRDRAHINFWAYDSGKSTDKNGRETHCMAVRMQYDVPRLTEISCGYETNLVACVKAPESRTVVAPV